MPNNLLKRRRFLQRLAGVSTVGLTAPAVASSQPERPLTQVNPYCPRCGRAVWFSGSFAEDPRERRPVVCQCGWQGESPRAVPVRD